jgi:hypothetical protein
MKKGKVAINISGVSRYLNESYQNIKDMIIQPLEEYGYEVDLFIHTWQIIGLVDDKWGFNIDNMRFTEDDWKKSKLWYEKNKSIRNSEIKKNINGIVGGWVRRLEVENHKQAMVKMNETIVKLPKTNNKKVKRINTTSQLYSKYQAGLLQQEWETENLFTYDVVMKMRTEVYFEYPIAQNHIETAQSKLMIPHYYRNDDYKTNIWGFNDTFALGPSLQMKHYNSSYERLRNIVRSQEEFNSHKILFKDLRSVEVLEQRDFYHQVGPNPEQRYSKKQSKPLKPFNRRY